MSYGVGIVIPKEDLQKEKIRFDYCDWTLPIAVGMYPEDCKKSFKKWMVQFESETKTTTLEKLKTAPCDCVCIIDSDGNFDTLKEREPLDCSNGSGNEYWYSHFNEYLTGIKKEKTVS
jgi:hypothetical protein